MLLPHPWIRRRSPVLCRRPFPLAGDGAPPSRLACYNIIRYKRPPGPHVSSRNTPPITTSAGENILLPHTRSAADTPVFRLPRPGFPCPDAPCGRPQTLVRRPASARRPARFPCLGAASRGARGPRNELLSGAAAAPARPDVPAVRLLCILYIVPAPSPDPYILSQNTPILLFRSGLISCPGTCIACTGGMHVKRHLRRGSVLRIYLC